MSRNQFSFYSTRNDLLPVLRETAAVFPFVFATINDHERLSIFSTPEESSDLGVMSIGDQNHATVYLLVSPDAQPSVEIITTRNGVERTILNQKTHPSSVLLMGGGLLTNANCIISGSAGTISGDNAWSISLYRTLFEISKKQFTKIKSYYVGNSAKNKMCQGFRLTSNVRSPLDLDLNDE